MIDDARERRYVYFLADTLCRFVRLCLVAYVVVHLDLKFKIAGTSRGQEDVVYPLFLIVLLRLVMVSWMTSSFSSKGNTRMLFRFLCDVSYFIPGKSDLRAFEDMWSRGLGIKTNLKKGICLEFLLLFLVPDVSLLSEPFKEDIVQRIEHNAPARRKSLKLTDKDSCKLSFGYVVFGVSF